jgi:hypothetical protein
LARFAGVNDRLDLRLRERTVEELNFIDQSEPELDGADTYRLPCADRNWVCVHGRNQSGTRRANESAIHI